MSSPVEQTTLSSSQPLQSSSWIANFRSTFRTEKRRNWLYTMAVWFNNFVYGFSVTLIGATLVDLRWIYGEVSLDTISYLSMVQYAGFLPGSFVAWTYGRCTDRQVTLLCMLLLCAVCVAAMPFYHTIYIAFPAMALDGLGMGAWVSTKNSWIIEMWPERNAVLLQINYVFYGLGTIVAPIIAAPYVHGEATSNAANETLTTEMRIRDLTVPYALNGALQAVAPLELLILYYTAKYIPPKTKEEEEQNDQTITQIIENNNKSIKSDHTEANAKEAKIQNGDHSNHDSSKNHRDQSQQSRIAAIEWRKSKLTLCGLAIAISVSAKIGYFTYSSAMFQHLEIKLSARDAAHVMSILSAAYTVGPLVTAFVSIRLKPGTIISYHFALVIASFILLYIGRRSLPAIYAASCGLGYGYSVLWPAIFAFTERYLVMTDPVSSFFAFMFGVSNLIIPMILGQTFRSFPVILIFLETAFVAFAATCFVIAGIWIYLSSPRKG